MDSTSDDLTTTQWAAVVAFMLVLLIPLAVALAAWAKHRYAAAVVRLQASTAAGRPAAPPPTAAAPTAAPAVAGPALHLARVDAADPLPLPAPAAQARRLGRRMLAMQFAAGLGYWWLLNLCLLLAAAVWMEMTGETAASDDGPFGAGHAVVWPWLLLPPVLGWAFTAGLHEGRVWAGGALATAVFGAGMVALDVGWVAAASLAAGAAVLAAMLAAFLRPAVRGAGPPLVAALTVGWGVLVGLILVTAALFPEEDGDPTAGEWLAAAGVLALLLLPAAWVAWRVLLRLARRYREKRFSEQQLAQGAYWGVLTAFVAAAVLLVSFDERTGAAMEWLAFGVLLLWGAWRPLQRVALWLARRGAPPALPPLVMLRVFKPSGRSESFTDRFLARWRFAGPVWMIAGPDLAGAYMEPDEFFAFLGRRLGEHFIADAAQVPAALAALDVARDPDARFRVSELFCSNATWQAAALALIERAGVVLLDLREFTAQRAGTRFELEEVLRRTPLARVVVVVDGGADLAPLQQEIQAAWQRVGAPAPVDGTVPMLRLVAVRRGSRAEMNGLVAAAAQAALQR